MIVTKELPQLPGLYKIINTVNGKRYVGSSVNIRTRIYKHLNDLKKSKHVNPHLQDSFNKHGIDAFSIQFFVCSVDKLVAYEQYCLDNMKLEYNVFPSAYSPRGFKHTEETKQKMREVKTGLIYTEEQRENNRAAQLLRFKENPVSEETRAKQSASHKARHQKSPTSEETRLKSSIARKAWWKKNRDSVIGKRKNTPETLARMSEAQLKRFAGQGRSAEEKANISAGVRAAMDNPEMRARLSKAQKSKEPISEETRKRQSIAQKNRNARKRAEQSQLVA